MFNKSSLSYTFYIAVPFGYLLYSILFNSTAVQCEFLTTPENGQLVLAGTIFGSTATYSCLPGFSLVGTATRTCQENREWSGQAPTCTGSFCSLAAVFYVYKEICD